VYQLAEAVCDTPCICRLFKQHTRARQVACTRCMYCMHPLYDRLWRSVMRPVQRWQMETKKIINFAQVVVCHAALRAPQSGAHAQQRTGWWDPLGCPGSWGLIISVVWLELTMHSLLFSILSGSVGSPSLPHCAFFRYQRSAYPGHHPRRQVGNRLSWLGPRANLELGFVNLTMEGHAEGATVGAKRC
jgi:hypothetical protein